MAIGILSDGEGLYSAKLADALPESCRVNGWWYGERSAALLCCLLPGCDSGCFYGGCGNDRVGYCAVRLAVNRSVPAVLVHDGSRSEFVVIHGLRVALGHTLLMSMNFSMFVRFGDCVRVRWSQHAAVENC